MNVPDRLSLYLQFTGYLFLALVLLTATDTQAQTTILGKELGLIGNDGHNSVVTFDPTTDNIIGQFTIPTSGSTTPEVGDVAINPHGNVGFVLVNSTEVYFLDLNASSAPTLSAGTNPVTLPIRGGDLEVTPNGQYLLVAGIQGPVGSSSQPAVSVIDIGTNSVANTYTTSGTNNQLSVSACKNGSQVLFAADRKLELLTISSSGSLSFSGTSTTLPFNAAGNITNVYCAPGSQSGIALQGGFGSYITSFTIPQLTTVSDQAFGFNPSELAEGFAAISGAFSPTGSEFYARSSSTLHGVVSIFSFNTSTGVLGSSPTQITVDDARPFTAGVEQLAVSSNDHIYVPENRKTDEIGVYLNQNQSYPAITGSALQKPFSITIGGGQPLEVEIPVCIQESWRWPGTTSCFDRPFEPPIFTPGAQWQFLSGEGEVTSTEEGAADWALRDAVVPVKIAPAPEKSFAAVDLTLKWNPEIIEVLSVSEEGGLFAENSSFQTLRREGTIRINASRLGNENLTTDVGDYIAEVLVRLRDPGTLPLDIADLQVRRYDGEGGQVSLGAEGIGARVRFLLGDVATPEGTSRGDGKVDFEDLAVWSGAYWSGVKGYGPGMEFYKRKFDIGPTNDGSPFSPSAVDKKIEFEDLVIFANSYGLSVRGLYGKRKQKKTPPLQEKPVNVSIETAGKTTGTVTVPIRVSQVQDLRAFSLNLRAPGYEFAGVQDGALLPEHQQRRAFATGLDQSGQVRIDGAVFGGEGLSGQGELVRVVLRTKSGKSGASEIQLLGADLRDSQNRTLKLGSETASATREVPSEYRLIGNYPNPFNPSTTIRYALPEPADIRLTVFDRLGREVKTLVDRQQEAGRHEVDFEAGDLPTGLYLYRLEAGSFVDTQTMVLLQ